MKIKVMTYNIHKGFDVFNTRFVLHEIKKAIQASGADIVLLQEVVGENSKHQKALSDWPLQTQFEFLADSLWPHYSYGKNAVFSYSHHGNALLSKFPIIKNENIDISTNRWESRGLLHCELELPELKKVLHVFNVHLDLMHKGRLQQVHKIAERAKNHVPDGVPFILGGDFNDWNQKVNPVVVEHLGVFESHSHLHEAPAATFPNFRPTLRLDRIYAKHLTVLAAAPLKHNPWTSLSDHLPLLVEFEIT